MGLSLEEQININIKTHLSLLKLNSEVNKTIKVIAKKIKNGGKLLLCGNGGSAADAQHLAAEFLVRLRPNVNRKAIPAISLAQDTSTLTACGNDYSFDDIFVRTLQAIGTKKDILVCISTSGNSKNILKVLKEAKKKNIYSVGFLGKGGGKAKKMCNQPLIISSNNTARIQECHIFLGHFILEKVEDYVMSKI
jgi:D-sedoheptulose 7-phosphate isomerase